MQDNQMPTDELPDQILGETDADRLLQEDLLNALATQIHVWINHDFERLVRFLYRLDVQEDKLRRILKDHPDEDAGRLIAKLIVDRQLQKIAFRKSWTEQQTSIDPAEAW
jgi:hypothetical protein